MYNYLSVILLLFFDAIFGGGATEGKVGSIQYLLCFDHIAPPRTSSKKRPKSEQPPGRVPEATFDALGRPLASFGRF